MAFGSPRFSITLINICICIIGLFLIIKFYGIVRLIGWAVLAFGVIAGAIMGSWSMLFLQIKNRWR